MKTIQSIDKAMMVVEEIAHNNGLLTLSDLGRNLKMALPTLCGFTASLEKWDLICRNRETGRFSLGSKIVQLNGFCDTRRILIDLIHPYLLDLSHRFDETVHLAFPDGNGILYQDKVESSKPLRMTSMVGTRETWFQSAIGFVLAANTPGLTFKAAETRLLKKICKGQTAVLFHADMGLYCIGAALVNLQNTAVAGISMAIPECRYSKQTEEKVLQELLRTVEELRSRV